MEELKEYIENNLSPIQCEMVFDEVIAELEDLTFDVILQEVESNNVSNEVTKMLNKKITLKGISNDIRSNIIARVSLIVSNLYKEQI